MKKNTIQVSLTHPVIVTFLQQHPNTSVETILLHYIEFVNLHHATKPEDHEIVAAIKSLELKMGTMTDNMKEDMGTMKNVIVQEVNGILDPIWTHFNAIHAKLANCTLKQVLDSMDQLRTTKMQVEFDALKAWLFDQFTGHLKGRLESMKLNDMMELRHNLDKVVGQEALNQERILGVLKELDKGFDRLDADFQRTNQASTELVRSYTNGVLSKVNQQEQDLNDIREKFGELLSLRENMLNLGSMMEAFVKPTRSSAKGKLCEDLTIKVFEKFFPSHVIESVASTQQKGNMDIQLHKSGFPSIMIDVKKYAKTVPTKEVEKFLWDIALGKRHAILLCIECQTRDKAHFEIEITSDYCIAIYLNNISLQDMSDVIRAVEMIYTLDNVISKYKSTGTALNSAQVHHANNLIKVHMEQLRQIKNNLTQSIETINSMFTSGLATALQVTQ